MWREPEDRVGAALQRGENAGVLLPPTDLIVTYWCNCPLGGARHAPTSDAQDVRFPTHVNNNNNPLFQT